MKLKCVFDLLILSKPLIVEFYARVQYYARLDQIFQYGDEIGP